jgi:hypothetical protein
VSNFNVNSSLRCFSLVFACAVCAAISSRAQSLPEAPYAAPNADPWTAPHFSVDPKILYQAATAVSAPEGANVAELCNDESYRFDAAGRMTHTGHIIYKVLTQKGAVGGLGAVA